MQIGIFVDTATTLYFTSLGTNTRLDKLDGGSQPLISKMPVSPGVYRIESDQRLTPKADPHVKVFVDADYPEFSDDGSKTPFPPDPPPGAVQLVATVHHISSGESKLMIQHFLTSAKAGPNLTFATVDIPDELT